MTPLQLRARLKSRLSKAMRKANPAGPSTVPVGAAPVRSVTVATQGNPDSKQRCREALLTFVREQTVAPVTHAQDHCETFHFVHRRTFNSVMEQLISDGQLTREYGRLSIAQP